MAAFRILSQSPVYFLLDGKTPAAGGRIEFYEAGTTTSKDVYGDQALTVNNGSSITLGSDGRASDDIWGDGSYRVRVYAADDTLISDDDNVEIPGGIGTAIPALEAGKVLSNDGAVLQWLQLQDVPDPTGQSGKILTSDGSSLVYTDPPADPVVPITVGADNVQFGNTSSKAFYIQAGTATAPASGTFTTSKAITFAKTFATVLHVGVMPQTVEPGGPVVAYLTTPATTGGFTAVFDVAEGANANNTIASDIPFSWVAFGLVNVT
jgi:hypothetical protein